MFSLFSRHGSEPLNVMYAKDSDIRVANDNTTLFFSEDEAYTLARQILELIKSRKEEDNG